jgi:hypothetical protein
MSVTATPTIIKPCSAEHAYGRAKYYFANVACTIYRVKFKIESEIVE